MDNKKYSVARYFDDHFECNVATGLTKEDADKKADELNSKPRAYVSYIVRPEPKPLAIPLHREQGEEGSAYQGAMDGSGTQHPSPQSEQAGEWAELKKIIEYIKRNAEKIGEHTWKVYKEQILGHIEDAEAIPAPTLWQAASQEKGVGWVNTAQGQEAQDEIWADIQEAFGEEIVDLQYIKDHYTLTKKS